MSSLRDQNHKSSLPLTLSMCTALVGSALSSLAFADEVTQKPPRQDETALSVGIGTFSVESIYVDGEDQNNIFPLISARYKRFYFQGFELGADLYHDDKLRVKFGIGGDFAGDRDRGDSDKLSDMEELDLAILANLSMNYKSPVGLWKVGISQDISDTHDGYSLSAGYSLPYKHQKWIIKPDFTISWQSDSALDYYYGVDLNQVTQDRAAYEADADIITRLGVQVGYNISPNLILMGGVYQTWYGDEISNSPIVDTDSSRRTSLMVSYKF
ncbi:MipA/OmpV family protein [Microbulbifer sp. ANSA003]|uniref:MipA/OmpV family protein n=1 Tax=Microbulbifer sp. ANSA003 TaxID=3243360 RepID=UPI004041B6AE